MASKEFLACKFLPQKQASWPEFYNKSPSHFHLSQMMPIGFLGVEGGCLGGGEVEV